MQRPIILVLTGATATGKTAAVLELAERLPISIISLDSAMVYRGMDIGTAKPSREILARHPHALVDIRDPAEPYSAADFVADADHAVRVAFAAQRTPVLVGGTMLYLKAFRDGLAPMPKADPVIRAELQQQARELGWPALYAQLQTVDPVAAAGIHPHNAARIERALEVYRVGGRPMSEYWTRSPGQPATKRLTAQLKEFALMPVNRQQLHQRIARRVELMLADGLVEEVSALYQRGDLHPELPSVRSVGYRQVWEHLQGAADQQALPERITVATRQLAKRQLTWLRGWSLTPLDWDDPSATAEILSRSAGASLA